VKSSKNKRQQFMDRAAKKKQKREDEDLATGLANGSIIKVDRSKITSCSWGPVTFPEYYKDKSFTCKDCGSKEVWLASQQKRWYEEQGGEIETKAVRCRDCRHIEKQRKNEARRIHLEGIQKKKEN